MSRREFIAFLIGDAGASSKATEHGIQGADHRHRLVRRWASDLIHS